MYFKIRVNDVVNIGIHACRFSDTFYMECTHTHKFLYRSSIPLTCSQACIELELDRIGETGSSGMEYH